MSSEEDIRSVYEGDISRQTAVVCSRGMKNGTGLYSGMGKGGYSIIELVPRRGELLDVGEMVRVAELDE